MVTYEAVHAYLTMISGAEPYLKLDGDERQRKVFTAHEFLTLYYPESALTAKLVALQTLYMTEPASAEGDEAVALENIRRSGAKSYSVDGVSVSFGDNAERQGVAPDVLRYFELIETQGRKRARVGRLI